jgi:hypothetical protein
MKSFIFLESLRKFTTNRQLKQKLKIFIGAGLVGCLIIGALVVWGGIAAFKTVSNIGTNTIVQDTIVQEKISNLETEVQNMPALVKDGCWSTLKSLMNLETWLEKPVAENYNNIKSACLNE